jgi:hypothetical protein
MVPPGCEDYWRSLHIVPLEPLPYWLRHAGTFNPPWVFCVNLTGCCIAEIHVIGDDAAKVQAVARQLTEDVGA